MVTGFASAPAPRRQARWIASATTASSWRTCPNVKARRNVPSVDGAITPERQHPLSGAGPESVGVVDVTAADQHRRDQRQHLAARMGTADSVAETDRAVDQLLEAEPNHERRRQQQPGIRDQRVVVEGRLDA